MTIAPRAPENISLAGSSQEYKDTISRDAAERSSGLSPISTCPSDSFTAKGEYFSKNRALIVPSARMGSLIAAYRAIRFFRLTDPIPAFPRAPGGNRDPHHGGIAVWLDSRQKHAGMTVQEPV